MFLLFLADNMNTATYSFVSLIVKMILLELGAVLSAPATDKTQRFVNLSLNLTLKFINGISSDLKTLLRCFNGTAIVVFFQIPFILYTTVFPNNLALLLKYLKTLTSTISALKLVASSLE